jgi:hypothetical protein
MTDISQVSFKNPNNYSLLKEKVAQILSNSQFSRSKFAYFLTVAGDILSFDRFCRNELKYEHKVSKRENIYDEIIRIAEKESVFLEFGVAHGYTTKYFLDRLSSKIKYVGFDLFTGLPKQWRNFGAGQFSNNGIPPEINDPRLEWKIGDVTQTFNSSLQLKIDSNYVILFDLDLLEPTSYVFQQLDSMKLISKGTILYFDEAFDPDELYVIKSLLIKKFEVKIIARNWSSIAFEVIGLKIDFI